MSYDISIQEFEKNLRRYFEADALAPAELKRLHAQWKKFASHAPSVAGLEPLFAPVLSPARGQAWWEERQAQAGSSIRNPPIAEMDLLNMFLSTDPNIAAPAARPYRPSWMAGRWECLAWSEDGEHFEKLSSARYWVLHQDGHVDSSVDDESDFDVSGSTWCFHYDFWDEIWFERERVVSEQVRWSIVERSGDEAILRPCGTTRVRSRWCRLPST
jgi:hypothetical protein